MKYILIILILASCGAPLEDDICVYKNAQVVEKERIGKYYPAYFMKIRYQGEIKKIRVTQYDYESYPLGSYIYCVEAELDTINYNYQ